MSGELLAKGYEIARATRAIQFKDAPMSAEECIERLTGHALRIERDRDQLDEAARSMARGSLLDSRNRRR